MLRFQSSLSSCNSGAQSMLLFSFSSSRKLSFCPFLLRWFLLIKRDLLGIFIKVETNRCSPCLLVCRLIVECWSEEPFRRPTFREIIMRLDDINNRIAQKSRWKVGPLKCLRTFEAMLKRDRLNPRSHSSRSISR